MGHLLACDSFISLSCAICTDLIVFGSCPVDAAITAKIAARDINFSIPIVPSIVFAVNDFLLPKNRTPTHENTRVPGPCLKCVNHA